PPGTPPPTRARRSTTPPTASRRPRPRWAGPWPRPNGTRANSRPPPTRSTNWSPKDSSPVPASPGTRRSRAASTQLSRKDTAMARTRFRSDPGLTLRMGGVGLGLGALYVAFGALLISSSGSWALGLVITLGMAWGQWYFSDSLALKAMGAKEVTPEQAPELHAMIDRLVALADMPKPRVAVAVTDMPNAFATGRSPSHSAVCVTTGILQRLDADELEG